MQKLKSSLVCLTAVTTIFLTVSAKPAAAQISIISNITDPQNAPQAGLNDTIQADFNAFASDFISATPLTFTATITWDHEGPQGLGSSATSAGSFQTVGGDLVQNPLDQYLYGTPSTINATAPDGTSFDIFLNIDDTLWSAPMAAPTDPTAYSLANVLYHETMHSMGFTADNNADGTFSFGAPTLWDTHLYDGITKQAFDLDTDAQRAAVMVSGDANGNGGQLFFDGAKAEAANGGKMVEMFAPSVFQGGSSDGSHIASEQPGAGLLYPSLAPGNYFTPSPLELAMMSDIGWNTQYNLGNPAAVPEASTTVSFGLLLALGLGGMVFAAKKKKASQAV